MRHKRRLKHSPVSLQEKEHVAHGWLFAFQSPELGSEISGSKWWRQGTGRDMAAPVERLSADDITITA